jgi:sulfur carrier protein
VIVVNGSPREDVAPGTTVDALLDTLALPQRDRGVAVAVDAEVVPRAEWSSHAIPDGARVEVLTAVQGG